MENCQSTPNYTVDRRSHTDPAVADSVSTSDSIAPKMRQRVPCVEGSPASPCSFFTCKSSVDSHQSSGNHLFENEKAVTVKSVAALHPLQEIPSSTSSSIFDASQSSAENPESCRQKLLDSVLGINLHNSFTVNDMGLQRVDEYENESPGNTPASPNKSDSGCTARPSLALIHLDEVISEVLRNSDGWYESKLDSFTHLSNSTTDQDLAPNETSIPLLYNTPLDTKAVNSRAHIKADVCSRNDVLWTCPIVLTSYEVALRDATYLRRIPFKVSLIYLIITDCTKTVFSAVLVISEATWREKGTRLWVWGHKWTGGGQVYLASVSVRVEARNFATVEHFGIERLFCHKFCVNPCCHELLKLRYDILTTLMSQPQKMNAIFIAVHSPPQDSFFICAVFSWSRRMKKDRFLNLRWLIITETCIWSVLWDGVFGGGKTAKISRLDK